jgi:signal transduction histidine kinase
VRLSTGRLQLDLEEVDLRSVLEEVAARFAEETQLVESPIALRIGPRLVGHWDRQRLEMVFTNLLSNAVKFGAHRPIAVTARAVGGDVIVQVRDEGIGVAPEDHERIFERFGRAVSGRHYGGFGLGLWMAREAVRAQGGDITVQSRPGEGATFTVRLPRRGPSNKTESPPRSQH